MSKSVLTAVGILLTCLTYGQDIEIEEATLLDDDFCSPGVLYKSPGKGMYFSYGVPINSHFYDRYREDGKISSYEILLFKVKVPALLMPRTKLLFGFKYLLDEYNFEYIVNENIIGFDPHLYYKTMRNSSLNLNFLQSLSVNNYFAVRASISTNGDFGQIMNFDPRYTVYKLGVLYGIKKNEHTEWALGFAGTHSFRGNSFYPFAIYNKSFNHRWGLECILPVNIFVRYNINKSQLLRAGATFNSKSYSLDVTNGLSGEQIAYNMNRMDVITAIEYQRQISGWVWLISKVGINVGVRHRFEEPDDRDNHFNVGAHNAFYGQLGFFLSPPQ